jgi:hypothetical protein
MPKPKGRKASPQAEPTDAPAGTPPTEKPIGMVPLQVMGARCRCGHEWIPQAGTGTPRVCPKCKSANWDQPKRWTRNQADAGGG